MLLSSVLAVRLPAHDGQRVCPRARAVSISESYKPPQTELAVATVRFLSDLLAEVGAAGSASIQLVNDDTLVQHARALLSAHVNAPPEPDVACHRAMRWRVDAALYVIGDRLTPTEQAALRELLGARTLPTNCNKLRQGPHNL